MAFCFFSGAVASLPDAFAADLDDLVDLEVFSVLVPAALPEDAEREEREDDALLEALAAELADADEAEEDALLPSSYLAACARDVPAALSAS